MFKRTIITLIGLLAIASALNANLEDSQFYINAQNSLFFELFQTRAGIIAHDMNEGNYQDLYYLIDLRTKNTSVILTDIVTACNNGPSIYDRLHYHAATSTLLYYCISNNTLLVIDQSSFTVELTIPTGVNTTFDEVRLVPQGYQIAILGMIGVFQQSSGISQLITVDLQSQTVARHVVFNYGFNTGETVVGYTNTTKNSLYILTSSANTGSYPTHYNVTLYSMFLIGNSYTINNITSFTYTTTADYPISTELYSVGEMVVVSYNQSLAVISSEGNVLGTVQGLLMKMLLCDHGYVNHVALAVQYGNSDFYALLANLTLLQFSVMNGGYNVETLSNNVGNMLYVTSNLTASSLLFTMSMNSLFNITDLQTSQVIYSTIQGATEFMVTDTTYAVIQQPYNYVVYIFSRETNLLISTQSIGYSYYYDENSHLISYMDFTNSSQVQCQMVQLDIQTLNSYVPFVLDTSYGQDCPNYHFLNVTNDLDTPQFILDNWENLLIYSENFGLVNYGSYDSGDINIPLVDYDTLTVYLAAAQVNVYNDLTIWISIYHPNNNSFTLQNKDVVDDIPITTIYSLPGEVMILSDDNELAFIDLSTLNRTVVSYPGSLVGVSFFQDKTGAVYVLIGMNYLYYDGKLSQLPGTTDNTRYSAGAGRCRYFVLDQLNGDMSLVRFYNVCTQGIVSEIYA